MEFPMTPIRSVGAVAGQMLTMRRHKIPVMSYHFAWRATARRQERDGFRYLPEPDGMTL